MGHIQEVHEKNNQILSLLEILYEKHKEFYKKYSENSSIEFFTKGGEFGVSIKSDEICILYEKGVLVQMDFGNTGWGGTIQPKYWEFDATNTDTEYNIWLSYNTDRGNIGDDLMITYNRVSKTIQVDTDIGEFNTCVDYNFKTKSDMQEILFKVSLELPNTISYEELKADMDRIRDFRKRKFPKGTNVQIWSYNFPMNIKELLEVL